MRFDIHPLTAEDTDDIAGWRYAAPYDVYDEKGHTAAGGQHAGLYGPDGKLRGYFCWQAQAQVSAAADIYAQDTDVIDFGIAMRPEMTGRGKGQFAVAAALAWLRGCYAPEGFRLAVYSWNNRAKRVYTRLGFEWIATRGAFDMMVLDERPWIDATRLLDNGMAVYHGDPPFDRHLFYQKENCGYDLSVISMSVHSGTHVDAPAHIGLPGDVMALPLDRLNGTVQLLDWQVPDYDALRTNYVLLKTGGRGLALAEAQQLVDNGIDMIGMDAVSAGEADEEWAVHNLLLAAGVIILENAAIEGLAPGWYAMQCLPLPLVGSDGAPVRLLLRKERPCGK